ncbi:MAG: hypothetical protein HGB15_05915 [Chlorobaculum sp.]|nr:hypothetical protein [Chlorobaculum sp.]
MIVKHLPRVTLLTRMLALVLLLTLSGCIQMHTTVHVKKDGSGTIEQKMLFTGMLSEIMNSPDEGGEPGKEPAPPSEKQLSEMAAEFGPEVKAVGVKKIDNRKQQGFAVTYAFDDIDKVRIGNAQQMTMNHSADSTAVKPEGTGTQKPETWFTFAMKRGANPELIISKQSDINASSRKISASDSKSKPSPKEQTQMLDMIKPFLKGLKMSMEVIVDGRVVRSDASYRIGNRITLYSMDFDKILARPDLLTGKYEGMSDKEFTRKSGKNSGLKFEFKDRVSVLFN